MSSRFVLVAERNIRILSERFSDQAKKLEEYLRARPAQGSAAPGLTLVPTGAEEWAARHGDGPNSYWLHPPPSPKQAALRALRKTRFPAQGLVVLWDVGLGYALDALAGFLSDPDACTRVVVCEEQIDLVWESLNLRDWSPVLADPRVCLLLGPGIDEQLASLLARHPSLLEEGCVLVPSRNLLPPERNRFSRLQDSIKRIRQTARRPRPGPPDTSRWVIASHSLAEQARSLAAEAGSIGMKVTVACRPRGLRGFLPGEDAWVETCGGVTPGYHLATYTSLFTDAELRSMGRAGTKRVLWFWDRAKFSGVDKLDAHCYDLLLVCERSEVSELLAMGFTRVEFSHAATGFSDWNPEVCPPPRGLGYPEVAYVGASGYRLVLDRPPFLPKEKETLRGEVSAVVERWGGGDPTALQEMLTQLASEKAGALGESGLRVTFQLATAEIRKMFLAAAQPYGLVIFGDALWGDTRYGGPLVSAYAGRSLDYRTETPHIYHRAKINLNIVHSSLTDTVAFRVFDVMACGGFLLSEHRPVLEELFEPGVHLDLFRDREELVEKLQYYLAHDEIRRRIAAAGQEKVLAEHTYASRLRQIVEWLKT